MPAQRNRFGMVLRGLAVGVCLWLIAAAPLAALGKNEVRELEDLLAQLGFDPGPVDGVLDAQTRTAIKGYQDFAALPVTGRASWSLLSELRGVAESLGDVRIPESAPRAVVGPNTVKTQDKVTEPALAAPEPPGPKPPAPTKAPVETAPVETAPVETAPVETAAVQTEATEAPAAATAPVSTGPATFEIALQLAAFRSEESAQRGWTQIQQQLPGLLSGMSPRFPAVDLGEEGIYYRVLTGPFPNRATAADLCAMMTAEGQECRVIQSAPQQVAAATPPTQAPAEPASPTPATATAEPARTEPPPKTKIGEPLAPPPTKPVVTQDEEVAAPLQLAEVETSAPSPESETPPAKKAGLVPPPAPTPTAAPPEPSPEVEPSADAEVSAPPPEAAVEEVVAAPEELTEPAAPETPEPEAAETAAAPIEQAVEEVVATPEETTEPAPSAETPEPAPSEVPQLAATQTSAPAADETAAGASAAAPEEALPQFAEAGVFSPFPVEDAPAAAQAPPSAAAEGPAPVPPSDLSEPALSETPQLASLPQPRAAGLQSADEAFDLNDCPLAIQLYTQALEQAGLSSRGQAEAYNNRGRCYLDGRFFEEAIADFNSAIDRHPNYAAAYFNRGRAHQSVGEAVLAQSDMQRAYELGFKRLGLSPTTP